MQITVEDLTPIKKKIGVAVPPDEVRAELDQAYRGLQRHARIKGFRPGKVPRTVLERIYGPQVQSEVIQKLIQDTYQKALEEHDLRAVARPDIVADEVRPEEGLRYSATIEIKPVFEVRDYEGIEVERAPAPVSEEAVDQELERLRQSMAQMVRDDERDTVAEGDLVEVAYAGIVDGRVLKGASADQRIIEVGAGTFPPPFDEQLVGATKGVPLRIDVAYPKEHHAKEIAGKTVTFRVEVKSIGRKEVPVLDDDFAKDHGECGSLAELRAKVRGMLEQAADREAGERMRGALLKLLVERNPIELPQALVDHRLEVMMRETGIQGVDPGDNAELAAQLDRLRTELRQHARQSVHSALVLERLAAQRAIVVDDAEVEARVAEIVRAAPRERDRLADLYRDPEARRDVRDRLAQEKALGWVVEHATIKQARAANLIAAESKSG